MLMPQDIMSKKQRREELQRFVGRKVEGIYPAPAITCFHNGRMVRFEGRVQRLGKHDYIGDPCLVVRTNLGGEICCQPTEIKCPRLRWVGEHYTARGGK